MYIDIQMECGINVHQVRNAMSDGYCSLLLKSWILFVLWYVSGLMLTSGSRQHRLCIVHLCYIYMTHLFCIDHIYLPSGTFSTKYIYIYTHTHTYI